MTPREIIQAEYGHSTNIMTPNVDRVGELPDGAYELSTGTGLANEPIYGVSVVRINADGTTRRDTEASKLFHSRTAALEYIADLQA